MGTTTTTTMKGILICSITCIRNCSPSIPVVGVVVRIVHSQVKPNWFSSITIQYDTKINDPSMKLVAAANHPIHGGGSSGECCGNGPCSWHRWCYTHIILRLSVWSGEVIIKTFLITTTTNIVLFSYWCRASGVVVFVVSISLILYYFRIVWSCVFLRRHIFLVSRLDWPPDLFGHYKFFYL
jgi:hypothetical protein